MTSERRWPGVLAALATGVLAAPGQAPWGLWPLTLLGMAGLFWLVARAPTAKAAFGRALLAGFGHFVPVMVWIVDPFFVDAAATGWMAPFALALMAGGMALFWALPAGLAALGTPRPVARVWRMALALLIFENLRGLLFTGFPWALSGHVWIGTPVDQLAALGGALLLSALTLSLAAALAVAALRLGTRQPARAAAALVLAALALAGGWLWGDARLAAPLPAGPGITLRLVQANVPQDLKWRRDLVEGFFQRHLDLSATPAARQPDLVIWPETAAPFLLDQPYGGLLAAADAASAPLVMGVQRRETGTNGIARYYNSLALIDTSGSVQAVYDKHHLVPFGEYIPLIGEWAAERGWGGLAQRLLEGYSPGPGPRLLDLGPAGRALPLICYEAVFARDLRGTDRPDWLLQATNDAWFGHRFGPYQHFAQARLRSVETGLPLVRAANTGISAVTDARGRITAELPLDVTGALDAALPGALPATLYARTGDAPWHLALTLAALALAFAAARGAKKGRRLSG